MRSHYLYNLSTGQEWRPIEDAFAKEPMYVKISRLRFAVGQYAGNFGREQLLIIESSD